MRLNSALIPTFLFVSGVLADYYPKKQQPPLLDHVEKSILLRDDMLGGATWKLPEFPDEEACFLLIEFFKFVAGTFIVPGVRRLDVGSGFNIALAANGGFQGHVLFGVGITVEVVKLGDKDPEVFYTAWGTCDPETVYAPNSLKISVGDMIGVVVQAESEEFAVIALINLSTGVVWGAAFLKLTHLRLGDVEWVVTELNPTPETVKVPNFMDVTFQDLSNEILGGKFYEKPQGILKELVMMQDYIRITHTMILPGFVVIRYVGPNTITV